MKNLNILFSALFLIWLSACAAPLSPSFTAIANTQPYVIQVSPEPYRSLDRMDFINITFSHAIRAESLSEESFYVVSGEIPLESIEEESLVKINGSCSLSEDSKNILWRPEENLNAGDYTLIIQPSLEGENHQPFNQKPGEDPQAFVATFFLGTQPSSNSPASGSGNSSSPTTPRANLHPPLNLVLNEILYDAAGSDTDGNEFIELYGTPEADLEGYQVLIINGGDGEIIDTLHLPKGSKINPNGLYLIADSKTNASKASNIPNPDFIDNFDPQNGPDVIQIMDAQGHLVDALCYGNGSMPLAQNGFESCEGSSSLDVGGGHSLSRVNGSDSNDNSADFIELSTPTPGEI